ncbi:hypothetical protein [Aquisalinus flavus]|uniref:Lipoprotein n=1 Tax=Aquisalinus flavus TaxID=1526572 RepID=A0A8J2V2P5_9PROT|nr:hypothetical protein [Aquisalinus flavus]MBD0425836.1 hypothetical protein [Aquisalinus flavus]UNE48561.1 hypothetical protein FF099_11135 [Aquisalinus flavus]GGD12868.1 hypothetical protein GCM10011342_22060 [Aquisalinus flavus]
MKRSVILSVTAAIGLTACDAETMQAIGEGLAQASYQNSYGYGSYGYGSAYNSPYGGYQPNNFGTGYWPVPTYSYGSWVGYNQCRNTGTFYTCDSNGDGYADMWGDTSDGSYSSQYSRVNGRGEGFRWDSGCSCWVRDRSIDGPYDGPRDSKYRDRYDDDDDYDRDRDRDRDRY